MNTSQRSQRFSSNFIKTRKPVIYYSTLINMWTVYAKGGLDYIPDSVFSVVDYLNSKKHPTSFRQ